MIGDSLKFKKRCQLFFSTNDKPLSVVAMCVSNKDRLPGTIRQPSKADS
jgi:hypothetical protein